MHTSAPKRDRMVWMDVIRGAAILMVIMYHVESQINSNTGGFPDVFAVMNDVFGPFRMPLLMILSGMLLPVSLGRPAGEYLKGKFSKIGWPYALWSVAFLGLLAATSTMTGNAFDVSDFGRIIYDPLSHLWYLAYLLVFYVACLVIPVRWHPYLIPASLGAALLVHDNSWQKMLMLFAFFLFGQVLARNWPLTLTLAANKLAVTVCAVISLTVATLAGLGVISGYEPLLAPLIATVIIAAVPVSRWLTATSTGAFLAAIGRQSIVYYASHFTTLIIAFNVLSRVGLTHGVALTIILPAAALVVGYLLVLLRKTASGRLLFELPTRRAGSKAGKGAHRAVRGGESWHVSR